MRGRARRPTNLLLFLEICFDGLGDALGCFILVKLVMGEVDGRQRRVILAGPLQGLKPAQFDVAGPIFFLT